MEELSQLILCSNQIELTEALNFNINSLKDRKRLLINMNKKIKPPNYMESNRLEQLITQAIKYQIHMSKLYHPSMITEFPSLQEDYAPPPLSLPTNIHAQYRDIEDEVWYTKVSNDSNRIVCIGANRRMIVYRYEGRQFVKQWSVDNIHTQDVYDCMWSSDDTRIVTCSKDKSIKIWMYEDGKLYTHIEDAHNDHVTSISRCVNSKDIYTSSIDGTICLWDSVGNKKYTIQSLRIKYLMVSSDGRYLYAVSGLNNIVIINLDTKEEVGLLYENDEILYACTNRKGDRILTNTSTHYPELHIWSVEKRCIEYRYNGHSQDKFITPCIFIGTHDDIIACGSDKGIVYLWHINVPQPIQQISYHKLQVNTLSYTYIDDVHYLISGSDDGCMMILSSHN